MKITGLQLPTDSLYKFMSIFGLVLFVAPFALHLFGIQLEKRLLDATATVAAYRRQLARTSEEVDAIAERATEFRLAAERTIEETDQDTLQLYEALTDFVSEPSTDALNQVTEIVNAIQNRTRERTEILVERQQVQATDENRLAQAVNDQRRIEDGLESHEANYRKLEVDLEFFDRLSWTGFALQVIGATLIAFGFTLWYVRLQRYIDMSVRRGVRDASGARRRYGALARQKTRRPS